MLYLLCSDLFSVKDFFLYGKAYYSSLAFLYRRVAEADQNMILHLYYRVSRWHQISVILIKSQVSHVSLLAVLQPIYLVYRAEAVKHRLRDSYVLA